MDERAVRALHSAVCFTLEKWCGQEKIDQEELQNLRPSCKVHYLNLHLQTYQLINSSP